MSGFSVGIQKQKISAAKAFRPVHAKGELSRAVLPAGYGKALLWIKNLQFLAKTISEHTREEHTVADLMRKRTFVLFRY